MEVLLDELEDELPPTKTHAAPPPPVEAPEPPKPPLGYLALATELLDTIEAELPDAGDLAAALHYEAARLAEAPVGDMRRALRHYAAAHERRPDHVPTLRGERRARLATKGFRDAVALLEEEARLTPDAKKKAALHRERARILADVLNQREPAREALRVARRLDPHDMATLRALSRDARAEGRHAEWAELLQAQAQAVGRDDRLRAAILLELARLREVELGDASAAAEEAEAALAAHPGSLPALITLERLYQDLGRPRDAARVVRLRAARAGGEEGRSALLHRAAQLLRRGQPDESLALLEEARSGGHVEGLVLEAAGRELSAARRFEEAKSAFEARLETLTDARRRAACHVRIAGLLEEHLGAPEEAAAHLTEAVRLDPESTEAARTLERLLISLERWEPLATLLEQRAEAATEDTARAALRLRLARIRASRLHDPEGAVSDARAALAACGDRSSDEAAHREAAFELLTRLLSETRRFEELARLLEEAADSARDDVVATSHLFSVGQLYEDALGRPDQAVHVYRRILGLAPGDGRALVAMRRAAARAGDAETLIEALELEADASPDVDHAVALTLRAGFVLLDELDAPARAIERFRKARDLDGSSRAAVAALARAYRATGRFEELAEVLKRAVTLTPAPREAAHLELELGLVLAERLGRPGPGLEALERAQELSPADPEVLAALEESARQRGDGEARAAVLEQAARATGDATTRGELWLRLGEVFEDEVDDLSRARDAYGAAIRELPDSTLARVAEARVRARLGEAPSLAEGDSVEERSEKAARTAAALTKTAGEGQAALTRLREALADDPTNPHLLTTAAGLERELGDLPGLARSLAALSRSVIEPGTRASALRELAHVEARLTHEGRDPRPTWEALSGLLPGDDEAAEALMAGSLAAGDEERLIRDLTRLAPSLSPALGSEALLRLGELLESRGKWEEALGRYRAALELDPESLGAARGAHRAAGRAGLPKDRAWAARCVAEQLGSVPAAVPLWLESAAIRAGDLRQVEEADADLERALGLDPDSEAAAAAVAHWLRGRPRRVIDLLKRAASTASQMERRRDLWMQVGQLSAESLDDVGAAMTALRRALAEDQSYVPAMASLAELEQSGGRHRDAALRWAAVIEREQDPSRLVRAHLRLAAIHGEALADPTRARLSLMAVLSLEDDHPEALERLARLELAEARPEEAASLLERLADSLGEDDAARGRALVSLSRARAAAGDDAGRDQALLRALACTGPDGEAMGALSSAAPAPALLEGMVEALRRWSAAQRSPVETAHGCAAAARLLSDELGDPGAAATLLRAGLKATGGLARLHQELGRVELVGGKIDAAIEAYGAAIQRTPADVESHAGVMRALEAAGASEEAALARQVVTWLGGQDHPTRSAPKDPRQGSLGLAVLDPLGRLSPEEQAAVTLLRAIAPAVDKTNKLELEAFGLVPRDRMTTRGGDPLRIEADMLASALGGFSFDLFVHRVRGRGLTVGLGTTPTLMVPAHLLEVDAATRRFHLARPMVDIARGLTPLACLTPREVEVLLASAARFVEPEFGRGLTSEEVLDSERKKLYRALPRRSRKPAEEAAQAYVEAGTVDLERLLRRSQRTSRRVAALLAGDFGAVADVLMAEHPEWTGSEPSTLFRGADPLRDLVCFWVSPVALHLRRHAGLLPDEGSQA